MRWLRLSAILGVAAVAAVAAGTTRGNSSGATTCTAAATKAAVAAFVTSFNRGDYVGLQAMFAPEPSFQWYSSNEPGLRAGSASKNRTTLLRYFRARHAKQDRLRLVSVRFTGSRNGYGVVPAHGNFSAVLRRSTREYRNGSWFSLISKGALVCSTESSVPAQFIVFSLGGPESASAPPSVSVAPQPVVGAKSRIDVYLTSKLPMPLVVEAVGPTGAVRVFRLRRVSTGIWSASGFKPARAGTWRMRVRAAGRIRVRARIKVLTAPVRRPVPPVATFVPLGGPGCAPPSPANATSREARGTSANAELWALIQEGTFAEPQSAVLSNATGRKIKIVWRMTGSGDPTFTLIAPDGSWSVVPHSGLHGSNWQRPGDEWGSMFFFSQPGCWQIHVERGTASADLWIALR